MTGSRKKQHAAALAGYVLLTLVFTWPLAIHLDSHIPALGKGGDAHSFVWNAWNFRTQLREKKNPLIAERLVYPFRPNLAFHTYTLLRNALVTLAAAVLPFAASFNLVTLLMFILSGYGAYLLTLRFCRLPFAAFLSGVVFSFCPFKTARLMAHYNLVDTAPIPFFIYFFFKALDGKRRRDAVTAGLFLALIAYSSYYYLIFSLLFVGLLFLFRLATRGGEPGSNRSAGFRGAAKSLTARAADLFRDRSVHKLAAALLVFLLLFSPIWIQILRHHREYFVGQGVFGDSPDLFHLVTPTAGSPLGRILGITQNAGTEKIIFLGLTVIVLFLFSFRSARGNLEIRFWRITALVYLLFSLGPQLVVLGRTILPLPYTLIHSLPLLSAARNPSRYNLFAMLALGIVSAVSLEGIIARLKEKRRGKWPAAAAAGLVLVLVVGEYLTVPLNLFSLKPHEDYRRIAADKENYALLELPFSISGKGKTFGIKQRLGLYQLYQTIHGKNLPSGWLANLPDRVFSYYRDLKPIHRICYLQERTQPLPEWADKRLMRPDPEFHLFLAAFDIRYIMVHRGAVKELEFKNLERYINLQLDGFVPYSSRKSDNLLRFVLLDNPPHPCLGKNLIDPEFDLLFTEGWSPRIRREAEEGRWTVDKRAVMLLPLSRFSDYVLEMDAAAPGRGGLASATAILELNDVEVRRIPIAGPQSLRIPLPPDLIRKGSNLLVLTCPALFDVPAESAGDREGGPEGFALPVAVEAVSMSGFYPFLGRNAFAGLRLGRGAPMDLTPGFNLFEIHENTGALLSRATFNTYASPDLSAAMIDYIRSIGPGRIVIALTSGDPTRHLSDGAVEALRSLGARHDLRETPGFGYALIGLKGSSPGTALENLDSETAVLRTGRYGNASRVGIWVTRLVVRE